jgi:dipeptidyl-peptidase III
MEVELTATVLQVMFLIMVRAGLRALELYDPVAKKHGQAHMQARYVIFIFIFIYPCCIVELFFRPLLLRRLGITQWLIKEGIARVEEVRAVDGTLENLYVRVGNIMNSDHCFRG